MKLNKLLYTLIFVLSLTSCGSIITNNGFSLGRMSLELNMNDLEYLGETEISSEYNTILGLFTMIEKVNGEIYNPEYPVKKLNLQYQNIALTGAGMDLAAYKLVELFPDATYYKVVYESTIKDRMFLGSLTKKVIKVRAYKLK
ncbi:MAG: hypothetical protein J6V02_08690 [Bacteroidaceae bacterium]|nr:hypothetical protein [Bacteroidaceae bacterium]